MGHVVRLDCGRISFWRSRGPFVIQLFGGCDCCVQELQLCGACIENCSDYVKVSSVAVSRRVWHHFELNLLQMTFISDLATNTVGQPLSQASTYAPCTCILHASVSRLVSTTPVPCWFLSSFLRSSRQFYFDATLQNMTFGIRSCLQRLSCLTSSLPTCHLSS